MRGHAEPLKFLVVIASTYLALCGQGNAADLLVPAGEGVARVERTPDQRALDWTIISLAARDATPETALVGEVRPPSYATYAMVHSAARRRGGYDPGQRVVIAVCTDEPTRARWARDCALRGWTFCVHNREQAGLECGIHQAIADERGLLHPVENEAFAAIGRRRNDVDKQQVAHSPVSSSPCVGGVCYRGAMPRFDSRVDFDQRILTLGCAACSADAVWGNSMAGGMFPSAIPGACSAGACSSCR